VPISISEASWTGLLDPLQLEWNQAVLDLIALSPQLLPPLCDCDGFVVTGQDFGTTKVSLTAASKQARCGCIFSTLIVLFIH
jgi:glycerol kinase